MIYPIKKLTAQCSEIKIDYSKKKIHKFLLISDAHFDNPKCDRDLLYKHMDQAVEEGAGILVNGDFFCIMQGKYDPRRSKSGIRPEHNKQNYIDLVINDTAELMKKYSKNLLYFGDGNHCTAVKKNLETDVLQRFVDQLNYQSQSSVVKGLYQGFVRFKFHHNNSKVRTKNLFHHHGAFGGVVTKGVLGVDRMTAVVPDADMIWTGHTHDRWIVEKPVYKLAQNGELKLKNVMHFKTGTYKEEFCASEGWAVERIALPKNLGGIWLEFTMSGQDVLTRSYLTN